MWCDDINGRNTHAHSASYQMVRRLFAYLIIFDVHTGYELKKACCNVTMSKRHLILMKHYYFTEFLGFPGSKGQVRVSRSRH